MESDCEGAYSGDPSRVATRDVIATKDLICRLSTPRFFTLDDTTYVSTIIHNYTDRQIDAKVNLKADGITLDDGNERKVTLTPADRSLWTGRSYVTK